MYNICAVQMYTSDMDVAVSELRAHLSRWIDAARDNPTVGILPAGNRPEPASKGLRSTCEASWGATGISRSSPRSRLASLASTNSVRSSPEGGDIKMSPVSSRLVPVSTAAATPAPAEVAITRWASTRLKSASARSARSAPRWNIQPPAPPEPSTTVTLGGSSIMGDTSRGAGARGTGGR